GGPRMGEKGNDTRQGEAALTASRQSKLVRLLYGVDHIATAIGERHDFRTRRLRLEQVGTEVGGVEGMADATEHLSPGGEDRVRSICFERMSKSVIDSKEEPGISALRHYRSGQARGQCIAVIHPGCFGRRTSFAREGLSP